MRSDKELWLPVKGFEGCYEVSNYGSVRSLGRFINSAMPEFKRLHPGRILDQQHGKRGYMEVSLKKDGKRVCAKVHRLVSEAWVDNFFCNATVNHKDGNKLNNHSSNLEWLSIQDNIRHARETGLTPRSFKGMNGFAVVAYNQSGPVGIYPSIRMAAEDLGVCGQNISSYLRGKQKSVKGYTFKLAS